MSEVDGRGRGWGRGWGSGSVEDIENSSSMLNLL